MKIAKVLLPVLLACCGLNATDGGPKNGRVIKLSIGLNRIVLPGNKTLIGVLAHRENFNAHGFDIFSLFIKEPAERGEPSPWSAVTFFDDEEERFSINVGGGADCLLQDFRLVLASDRKSILLVRAERDLGSSFADASNVTFSFYEFRNNSQGEIGRPLYYFQRVKVQPAKRQYCDVGEAIKSELELGSYMHRAH